MPVLAGSYGHISVYQAWFTQVSNQQPPAAAPKQPSLTQQVSVDSTQLHGLNLTLKEGFFYFPYYSIRIRNIHVFSLFLYRIFLCQECFNVM